MKGVLIFCLNLHRFYSFVFPHLMISLRRYIKHSKECFIRFPNTLKWVRKTRMRLVFQSTSRCLEILMNRSSSCFIYYFPYKRCIWRHVCSKYPAMWLLERFSFECRETKTKVITLTNHNSRKQSNEPIRARSKYMSPVPSAGKCVRVSHNWFWFYF